MKEKQVDDFHSLPIQKKSNQKDDNLEIASSLEQTYSDELLEFCQ